MSIIEKATTWMENTARDNRHGYDQQYRWGERGDYDCSAAVITAWETAGVPVKEHGATYTGNILRTFKACGFSDVTGYVNRATGYGLHRGDILLASGHHVAMYCGNGKEVEASINEKGKTRGGKPGDQTGKEFCIRNYRNYPWTNVLRYNEPVQASPSCGKKTTPPPQKTSRLAVDGILGTESVEALQRWLGTPVDGVVSGQLSSCAKYLMACPSGVWRYSKGGSMMVKALQRWLGVSADGYMGRNTIKALQERLGVTVDGYLGKSTAKALQTYLNSKER